MDSILSIIFGWQLIIFCLAISAIVFLLRAAVEYTLSNYKVQHSKLWTELVLPILPILVGLISALSLSSFPYPPELNNASSRGIFGLVAGFFSELVYRIIKGLLVKKFNITTEQITTEQSVKTVQVTETKSADQTEVPSSTTETVTQISTITANK